MVLMLDLGRPDRLIVAATHYNFTSVFAWNVFLYSGMCGHRRALPVDDVRAAHEPLFQAGRPGGLRLALRADHRHRLDLRLPGRAPGLRSRRCWRRCSSCCPSAWGLAVFLLVQSAMYALERPAAGRRECSARLTRLLGVFVAAVALLRRGVPPDQPVLRAPGARSRPSSCVDGGIYPAAVLGRLRAGRHAAAAAAAVPSAPGPAPRAMLAAALLVVLGALGLAVRHHHRRPGLSAGDLPRLHGRAAASSTARSRTTRPACRKCCSARRRGRSPSC